MLGTLAERMRGAPFDADSLTEDYELGLRIRALGGRSCFLRVRGDDGELVATRACFPARIDNAVRQKARWVHGIALQGWDRLGWSGGAGEYWMLVRDRRGPMTALVLLVGYLLLVLGTALLVSRELGLARPWREDRVLDALLAVNLGAFLWRAAMRFAFTTREYGWKEGLRALMRIPVANIIAIMAGRRALAAYVAVLFGAKPRWDKTFHHAHPATGAVRYSA
jgi:adsorption protein B